MQTLADNTPTAYAPDPGAYDEAWDEHGDVRTHYEPLIDALAGEDLGALARAVAHDMDSRGAAFRGAGGDEAFRVDPIPRLITADEWAHVERGLKQRVRALNGFLADVYGAQEIFDAGVVPRRLIETGAHYEPLMRDVPVANGVYANAVGLDLVRTEDGRLHVLEDNVRTPSGYVYLLAARDSIEERLPDAARRIERESISDVLERLSDALRAAAPEGVDDPQVAMLSDGPANSAWWEHGVIARRLGLPVVTLHDLVVRNGRVHARIGDGLKPIDVLYRRTDNDLLQHDGATSAFAEVLLEPLRNGVLSIFNSFGAGIADDKLTHAYLPAMIDFYLGEEPILPSVETLDLAAGEWPDELDDLVVKGRFGEGGYGVTIVAEADRAEREELRAEVQRRPQDFIAQRRVTLSTHPTVIDGALRPRHVDLRPFCLQSGDDVHVVAGGLTRVALGEGALVVNSSQNGGGKDTWVLR